MKTLLPLIIASICLTNLTFAQSIPELDKNPLLDAIDADSISRIDALDNLKPVFYSEKEGYTIDPLPKTGLKVYGCKGDFNSDDITDYALILRDSIQNEDQLSVLISGIDTLFTLNKFPTLNDISEKDPYSASLRPPKCYEKSESGVFEGLYGEIHEMPGDLIRYGWYSYVWNKKNSFTEILTSD